MSTDRTKAMKLSLTQAELAFGKTHAFIRDVSLNKLIVDVFVQWIRRATPLEDPRFTLGTIGHYLPPPPRGPYDGYIESLRFLPENECALPDQNEPPPITARERFPDE